MCIRDRRRPTNAPSPTTTSNKPIPTVANTLYDFHPFFKTLTPVEMDVVCQAEEELDRRGSFTRIFPPMPVPPTSLLYDKTALSTVTTTPLTTTPVTAINAEGGCPPKTTNNTVLMSSQGWEGYRRFYVEPRPYNEVLHTWEYVKQVDPPSWYSSGNTAATTTTNASKTTTGGGGDGEDDDNGGDDDEDASDTNPDE
eukprot:TRINITY_DN18470_c0_g1_i4.p1 TRINITY_DN18470_c0_g1~~TRINITY_DN18470_c0_g1_i4.p1  ORF type:complete len:197 (-),score=56.90 TRINITY_DN18470_c0_g1_i4:332-922(-)